MPEISEQFKPSISEKKEFDLFTVEVFSAGKKDQESNEDLWVATANTLAVIDGVSAKGHLKFGEQSSGQFAAQLVKEVLLNSQPEVTGKDVVELLTRHFRDIFQKREIFNELEKHPENRPSAVFAVARVVGDKLIITQVGDVSFRINGTEVFEDPLEFDRFTSWKRAKAIKLAKKKNPEISNDQLLEIGRKAIEDLLASQQRLHLNNPRSKFGYGAIDGRKVPEKFIKAYSFDLEAIETLEIFSDGYFKIAAEPTIQSWEKEFAEVERVDPLKIGLYPSMKGSGSGQFTDDRTILIARFKPRS